MLTIGKLGAGQEAYYLGKVAQGTEDYYSGEGETEGRWTGDAAAELGLEGNVGPDQRSCSPAMTQPMDRRFWRWAVFPPAAERSQALI
jgi:hypothetical protein